ncbi:MAG TPA: GYF domain-containing protein [Phycisphaerae bacterium]|nr:GYF domain-containing protein [Phycisphaerae bacterium]
MGSCGSGSIAGPRWIYVGYDARGRRRSVNIGHKIMSQGSYYLRIRGKSSGPYDLLTLKQMIQRGQISRAYEISTDQKNWRYSADVTELYAETNVRTSIPTNVEKIVKPNFAYRAATNTQHDSKIPARRFDLNIEKFLEHWDVEQAIREIIANALDEQALTQTQEVVIQEMAPDAWCIRDFGRGLRIEHFTLNENDEKHQNRDSVIGKFGVGLKDAIATLCRIGVTVQARSRFGVFRVAQLPKHGFGEIQTIHILYDDTPQEMCGTEFTLSPLSREKVEAAKHLFMQFSGDQILENTPIGDILRRGAVGGKIYISGVLAADEPNFLFSYNVRQVTPAMQKKLNRERGNIGRSV